jgi:hypothetical protein
MVGRVFCPQIRLGRAADGTVWAESALFPKMCAPDLSSLLPLVEQALAQHGETVPEYQLVGWTGGEAMATPVPLSPDESEPTFDAEEGSHGDHLSTWRRFLHYEGRQNGDRARSA